MPFELDVVILMLNFGWCLYYMLILWVIYLLAWFMDSFLLYGQCLKFKTDQAQDAKKMEKLNNIFFALMVRGPDGTIPSRNLYIIFFFFLKLWDYNLYAKATLIFIKGCSFMRYLKHFILILFSMLFGGGIDVFQNMPKIGILMQWI